MSYNFNPMTDEELESYDLLKDGIYDFEVIKSTYKTSKSGNPMAELQLNVWDSNGKIFPVFDYLVFSQVKLNIKKISHFCKSVGLVDEFKKGSLRENLTGLCGKVHIDIQEPMPKPTGGFYDKKNVVSDYIKSEEKESKDEFNDELPF